MRLLILLIRYNNGIMHSNLNNIQLNYAVSMCSEWHIKFQIDSVCCVHNIFPLCTLIDNKQLLSVIRRYYDASFYPAIHTSFVTNGNVYVFWFSFSRFYLVCSCKEYQNLNAFFAVVMGLSNNACSRLIQSWDKVPSKFKKLFMEFEALIDPSRNHRAYR